MDVVLAMYWITIVGGFCLILSIFGWLADKLAEIIDRNEKRSMKHEQAIRRAERR